MTNYVIAEQLKKAKNSYPVGNNYRAEMPNGNTIDFDSKDVLKEYDTACIDLAIERTLLKGDLNALRSSLRN